jgi:hypothetical protein
MKGFNILLIVLVLFYNCKQQNKQASSEVETEIVSNYSVFGEAFDSEAASSDNEMFQQYQNLAVNDTVHTQFQGTVTDVCKAKGCWMKVALDNGEVAMVTFKDYGFFVPQDIEGKEVIISGRGFIEEMSVEDQQHFAEDAGESAETIAQITDPKKTYSFIAEGVLLKD